MKIRSRNELIFGFSVAFGLIFLGFLIGNVIKPFAINHKIKKNDHFQPGGLLRPLYLNMNFPIFVKVYLFNITNPNDVLLGVKPELHEIGPYVFEQWIHKNVIEDDDTDDTMVFDQSATWKFNKEQTLPLTGEEAITTLHTILVGGLIKTIRDTPEVVDLIMDGLDRVTGFKTDPFITVSAMEMLWDGVYLNCDHKEFSAKAVCAALGAEDVVKVNSTHFRASFFGYYNDTVRARYKIHRGKKQLDKINVINAVDGKTELDKYDDSNDNYCNTLRGTDGKFYPPFLKAKKSESRTFFAPEACRSFDYIYEKKVKFRKVPGLKFTQQDFDDSQKPYQCYCRDEDLESCPPRGTFDLTICLSVPIIMSKPHFYRADPKLLESVNGLSPNKEKHESFIIFEKSLGAPMLSAHRFQLNLDVEPVQQHPATKNLPKIIFPIFWNDIGGPIENELWGNVKKINRIKKTLKIVKYLLIVSGFVVACVTIIYEMGLIGGSKPIEPTEKTDENVSKPGSIYGNAFEYEKEEADIDKP